MRKLVGQIVLLSSLAAALTLAPRVNYARTSQPTPPPMVCVDGSNCVKTATTNSSAPAAGIKWHPGVYIFPGNVKCDSSSVSDDFATIDQTSQMPQIAGYYIRWNWNCFEGNNAGDYSAAFSRIDSYIAKIAPSGKRLMLSIWPMFWGTCDSSNSSNGVPSSGHVPLPTYITNMPGWVYYCQGGRTYTVAFDQGGLVDRMISLSGALAARYDNNPTVVMWEPHEETAGLLGDPSKGWNWDAAQVQWKRLFAAMATQWNHTNVRDAINWMKDNDSVESEILTSRRPGVVFGGADSIPENIFSVTGNYVFRGLNAGSTSSPSGSPHSGWADHRDTDPWVAEIQGGSIYGNSGSLQQFQSYAHDTMHARFEIWMRQSWDGYTPRYWSNVLPFIASGNASVYSTDCPPGWTCTN